MIKRKAAIWTLVAILIAAQSLLYLGSIRILAISSELAILLASIEFAGSIIGLIDFGVQHA